MSEIVSNAPFVSIGKFNYFREFVTEETPLSIYEILENYKNEVNNNAELAINTDKKNILITDKSKMITLKLKFLKLNKDDEDEGRLAMRFSKKTGSIAD
jgi:tricorn protease-like protein